MKEHVAGDAAARAEASQDVRLRDGGGARHPDMRRELEALIESLPIDLVEVVGDVLERISKTQETGEHLDPDIWGEPPNHERYAEVTLQAHLEAERARQELLERSLPFERAAQELAASEAELRDLIDDGHLVAVLEGDQVWLPRWQFRDGGVLPGLAAIRRAFPGSVLWLSAWMTTPHQELDGAAPRDVLGRGQVDRVLALVRQMHD